MRTLHLGLRVGDLDRSLGFYEAVGYEVVGRVPDTPIGRLTMLKLPDDEFVTLELVDDPDKRPTDGDLRLSHLVVEVASMEDAIAALRAAGIHADEPTIHDGSDGIVTTMIADPDGNQIELVQWPPGHPVGMTAADFET